MSAKFGIEVFAHAEQAHEEFKKVQESVKAVRKPVADLGKEGSDTAALLKKIGDVGPPAMAAFVRSTEAADMSVDELKKKLRQMANEANKAASEGIKAAREHAESINHLAEAMLRVSGIEISARGVVELTKRMLESADEAQELEISLRRAFGAAAEPGAFEKIKQLNEQFGINEQQAAAAAKTLQKYGQYSEENFDLVAKGALATGTSIEEAASALGRFQEKMNARTARSFREAFGIDPDEIAQQNGLLDATGKIVLDTQEKVQIFGEKMRQALKQKIGPAVEEDQSSWRKLGAEIKHFSDDAIGAPLLQSFDWLIKHMRTTDEEAKQLQNDFQDMTEKVQFNPAVFDRIAAAKASAAKKMEESSKRITDAQKQEQEKKDTAIKPDQDEAALDRIEKVKSGTFESKQAQIAAIDDLVKAYGNGSKLMEKAEQVRLHLSLDGNKEITKLMGELFKERGRLAKEAAAEELRAEEHTLEAKLTKGEITHAELAKQYERLAQKAKGHADERAHFEAKAAEEEKKAQEDSLKNQLHVIEQKRKNSEMTAAQEITSLQEILQAEKLTAQQRMDLENKLTEVKKREVDERQAHELKQLEILEAKGKATIEDRINLLNKQAKDPGLDQAKRDEKLLAAANEQKKLRDQHLSQERELAKLQEDRLKRQEAELAQQADKGTDEASMAKRIDLIRQRYAIERQEIEQTAKEKQEKAELTAAKLLDLAERQKEEEGKVGETMLTSLEKLIEKYQQAIDKKKELNGEPTFHQGGQGLTDTFKEGSNFGFSLGGNKGAELAPELPAGLTADDVAFLASKPSASDPRVAQIYNKMNPSAGGTGGAAAPGSTPTFAPAAAGSNGGGSANPDAFKNTDAKSTVGTPTKNLPLQEGAYFEGVTKLADLLEKIVTAFSVQESKGPSAKAGATLSGALGVREALDSHVWS